MSRGRGTIDDNLLKLMAQELNEIRLRDFKQAISCVIERDDFIKMVSRSSPQ